MNKTSPLLNTLSPELRDASKSILKFATLLGRDHYVEVDTLAQRQHPGSTK